MCQNWRFYLLRRFCITNISIFSLSFFCRVFPLALFFSYLFSFGVLFWFILVFFQQWRMTWLASSDCITDFCQNWSFLKLWRFEYYEEFKIWFSLFCRVLLLALFFFVPVFISCLFRGDEWHNYFTSVIGLYNRLPSKMGPFWTSGEFSITYSLKFGFSLFCWVLHLAYFFLPVFTSCSFVFFVFFSPVI